MTTTNNDLAVRETGYALAPQAHAAVLDFSGGSLRDKWQMAEMLASSQLVPKDFRGKPGDILIVADLGASLGMSVAQALQSIACINGRPTMWGDGMLGVVRRSPRCEWIREEEIGQPDSDGYGYKCSAKRDDDPNVIVNTFTVGDAKRAKLFGKEGPWSQYGPRRMCRMRARSWTLRDGFADVLKGLAMREEIVDVPAEVRASIVNAPTRTDALKAALSANTALAAAPAIPIDEAPSNETKPAQSLEDVLNEASKADPDFKKITGVAIKSYIAAEAEKLGLKPWELAEVAKSTSAGKLLRENAVEVLRLLRERAIRTGDGIAPPAAATQAEPQDEVPTDEEAPAPDFSTMTSDQLRDYVEDIAAASKVPEAYLKNVILRAHASEGITPGNIGLVLSEIDKRAKA